MNVKLLRRIQKHILAEPRRLNMNVVVSTNTGGLPEDLRPPCGTVGCIAGWACLLSGMKPFRDYALLVLVIGAWNFVVWQAIENLSK